MSSGIDSWNTKPLISKVEGKLRKILKLMAIYVKNRAQYLCPYITGHLRRSITFIVESSKKAMVGTNVEYAKKVEENKPYLKPALDGLTQKDVNQIVKLVG